MTLEELLLKIQSLQADIRQVKSERLAIWGLEASLNVYKLQLADFIMEHASEIISWERQHTVRLSILDDNE